MPESHGQVPAGRRMPRAVAAGFPLVGVLVGLMHWILVPSFTGVRNPLWALLLGGGAVGVLLAWVDARLQRARAQGPWHRRAAAAVLGGGLSTLAALGTVPLTHWWPALVGRTVSGALLGLAVLYVAPRVSAALARHAGEAS